MLRRNLLKAAGLAGAGLMSGVVPVGRGAWAAVNAASRPGSQRLVVVLLRGAVDGLNVVVPYADPGYYRARSSIAMGRPGSQGGVIDLDGRFGLHPALAPIMPMWQSGTLGFVQACGSPDPTRSHFDAQDYMESATPGRKATPDGWMNRLLGDLPMDDGEQPGSTRAVSIGPVLPRIYAGRNAVANIANGASSAKETLLDRPQIGGAFSQLYAGDDKMSLAFQQSVQAHREVRAAMDSGNADDMTREMNAANNGAPLPNGFPDDAARLARLMRNDHRVQLAFMALGGWDTHANQGAATGQLANRLAPLGAGLAALASGLGPAYNDTVIVVMSEFGRTVRQNGNGGTDHGHANVMWLMGGPVAGGKVHGQWPGLDPNALYEGRDLALTTDFREPLAQIAERHLGLPDARLAELFPGYSRSKPAPRVLRA
jgi:uncharacterized protein (DUF1501 family)